MFSITFPVSLGEKHFCQEPGWTLWGIFLVVTEARILYFINVCSCSPDTVKNFRNTCLIALLIAIKRLLLWLFPHQEQMTRLYTAEDVSKKYISTHIPIICYPAEHNYICIPQDYSLTQRKLMPCCGGLVCLVYFGK